MLKEQYKIRSLGLFGSYVRGEQKKNSDVDILVEFCETPGLFTFIRLEEELSRIIRMQGRPRHEKLVPNPR